MAQSQTSRTIALFAALAVFCIASQARRDLRQIVAEAPGPSLAVAAPAPAPAPAAAAAGAPSDEPSFQATDDGSSPKFYTLAEVATHSSNASIWAAINGKVYDLTEWPRGHPGGASKILAIAGTDASDQFNEQHGGKSKPAGFLAGFYIGELAA